MAPPVAGGGALLVLVFPPHAGDQPHSRQPLNQLCPPIDINPSTRLLSHNNPKPLPPLWPSPTPPNNSYHHP
ncbi:hypothetical protein CUMW_062920 [Citrus unshiu]|nr:hypothetical protein CUMW_062920 [Citrus unshiu]